MLISFGLIWGHLLWLRTKVIVIWNFQWELEQYLFKCFQNIVGVCLAKIVANKKLFKFYVTHSKPQYVVWSLKKIVVVKKCEEEKTDGYTNYKFTVLRGLTTKLFEFSFTDLPIMNPYDWFMLFSHLMQQESKFASQLQL